MRRFTVAEVVFEAHENRLLYWATRGAQASQVVAAVGFAVVSIGLALFMALTKPLSGLLDPREGWNSAAVLILALFGGCLLVATPDYLRGASAPFVLNQHDRTLTARGKMALNLGHVTEVALKFSSGMSGRYSSVPTWTVAFGTKGKLKPLPLLRFQNKADAERAAQEVSNALNVPFKASA